ncbi:MAG TPA: hypothetical protein VGL86_22465 [Polyangia bacterium]
MLMSGGARVLDRARGRVFGAVGRLPAAQTLARRRGLRLAVVGAALVLLAFAGVATLPIVMLAIAPVVLGVPHVAADLRYLVLRRATLARRSWAPLAVAAVMCTVAAALGELRLMIACGLGGVALAAALAEGRPARRALVTVAALALGGVAMLAPRTAAVSMAQAHNFIAVGLALWIVRDKMRAPWLPALLFSSCVAAIALGALDAPLAAALAHRGRAGAIFAGAVAPADAPSLVVIRAVGIFAFAQAVHYGAWLRLVPDGERAGERPIGYRHSLALLRADFGGATAIVIILSIALPLAACFALADVRAGYFTLAAFHGYLELAFVAAALAR